MCRYAFSGPYKEKWACFKCRKSFKQTNACELTRPVPLAEDGSRLVLCPQCKSPMHDMGLDFKAPKQTDVEQWKKIELLFREGYNYSSCGCGPGPRPKHLKDVPAFLQQQEHAAERRRQQRMDQRAAELKAKRKKNRKRIETRRLSSLAA
jgi:hypothetical protein